jgi:hypothetical protein
LSLQRRGTTVHSDFMMKREREMQMSQRGTIFIQSAQLGQWAAW